MEQPESAGALDRVRSARLAEAASAERRWDLARLPARRGEEPIEAAIDRLLPTFMEVAMDDLMSFAMNAGGSLPFGSAAGALGAQSRPEMRLYVADWILRADLADPELRQQDSPLADRTQMFEEVCRLGILQMGFRNSVRNPGLGQRGLLLLLGLALVLLGVYALSNP